MRDAVNNTSNGNETMKTATSTFRIGDEVKTIEQGRIVAVTILDINTASNGVTVGQQDSMSSDGYRSWASLPEYLFRG
jgi:hypothetical protein